MKYYIYINGVSHPATKKGKTLTTRCPFHEEKTPSLILNEEENIFHCLGCGKTGNASVGYLSETKEENIQMYWIEASYEQELRRKGVI